MTIYAQAAAQSGAVHWVGMGSDEELEEIVATGARTIKIIKPHADHHHCSTARLRSGLRSIRPSGWSV